jgi:glycosyltransferase involved in cell wall biosynthesis
MTNILVANNHLFEMGGSETFTYTLIEEISKRKDFNVEYFTFRKGVVSNKIENDLGVKFCSKKKYDLILANHNSCVDLLYPKGFTIQTCHGIYPQLEQPSNKADAHVSISQEVQDYLALRGYCSRIILNGINLERFKPETFLSPRLKTILSLCHSEEANKLIENICEKKGYNFLKAFKYSKPEWNIEKLINRADLVVGLGRSAYEAMACGRPVVVFDKRNYFKSCCDGYVSENIGFSILYNCSGRYSKRFCDESDLQMEFSKYNVKDSEFLRTFAVSHLNIKDRVDDYIEYYQSLLKNRSKITRNLGIALSKHVIGKKNLSRIIKFRSDYNQK